MRITDVRAMQPVGPGSPPDWRTSMGQILVAIDTDAGLTGYGVGGGGLAGVHVARTVLRDLLLNRDPEPVEQLWETMYQAMMPYGQKGLAIMALSGVDLALWDLRGKAAGKPVAVLLGGRAGVPIPTYTTVWGELPPEASTRHQGYKLHLENREPQAAVRILEHARRQIGPDRDLMLDAWMQWDVNTTLELADAVRALHLIWLEEPLPADDLDGYAVLRDRCPIPIAGGEHEFTARGFRPLIQGRLHQVLQPDVCWCGGMTELVKIYAMAKAAGLRVCPHRGGEIWGLHAITSLDPHPLAESGRPWMTWVAGQPPIVDGFVRLSDTPGFGIEIDETNLPVR